MIEIKTDLSGWIFPHSVEDAFELHLCNCVGPTPGEKKCKCQLEMDRIKQDDLKKFHEWVKEWPSQKN